MYAIESVYHICIYLLYFHLFYSYRKKGNVKIIIGFIVLLLAVYFKWYGLILLSYSLGTYSYNRQISIYDIFDFSLIIVTTVFFPLLSILCIDMFSVLSFIQINENIVLMSFAYTISACILYFLENYIYEKSLHVKCHNDATFACIVAFLNGIILFIYKSNIQIEDVTVILFAIIYYLLIGIICFKQYFVKQKAMVEIKNKQYAYLMNFYKIQEEYMKQNHDMKALLLKYGHHEDVQKYLMSKPIYQPVRSGNQLLDVVLTYYVNTYDIQLEFDILEDLHIEEYMILDLFQLIFENLQPETIYIGLDDMLVIKMQDVNITKEFLAKIQMYEFEWIENDGMITIMRCNDRPC